MPAQRCDKSYKGPFILSERRDHQHQTPENNHQALPEKLCASKSLIPNQQSQSNSHILNVGAALDGSLGYNQKDRLGNSEEF